jgi:hypothetical protein
MANEMPSSADYQGHTAKVLAYSEEFLKLVRKAKAGGIQEADWADMETIVDPQAWGRQGVFVGEKAETFGWPTYKESITKYAAYTDWEGTLRHVTEQGNRVILELEERNTVNGKMDVSNTVTIYEFDDAGKLVHLDVYVMPLPG